MNDKLPKTKLLMPVVGAAVFCGALLYATGQALNYMFRDVDPDRLNDKDPDGLMNEDDTDPAEHADE